MKTKRKAILIAVIGTAILVVAALIISHEPPFFQGKKVPTESILIANIEAEQEAYLLSNKKHLKIPKTKIKDKDKDKDKDIEYQVIEYETSKGEVGYQVIIWSENSTKSIGYGVEAEWRTYEIPIIATTTE